MPSNDNGLRNEILAILNSTQPEAIPHNLETPEQTLLRRRNAVMVEQLTDELKKLFDTHTQAELNKRKENHESINR